MQLGSGEHYGWERPRPQERVNVAAWTLSDDDVLELELELEEGVDLSWAPPKPLPDLWLWVRG